MVSKHSSGQAIDIAGVPQDKADEIAAACNMYRPYPIDDKPHYQPR